MVGDFEYSEEIAETRAADLAAKDVLGVIVNRTWGLEDEHDIGTLTYSSSRIQRLDSTLMSQSMFFHCIVPDHTLVVCLFFCSVLGCFLYVLA